MAFASLAQFQNLCGKDRGRSPRVQGEKKMEKIFTKFGENFRESPNLVKIKWTRMSPKFVKLKFVTKFSPNFVIFKAIFLVNFWGVNFFTKFCEKNWATFWGKKLCE